MRFAHVYLLCLLLTAEVSLGQSRDSVYTMGEITVTATRERISASRAPQRVSVLDAEAVEASGAQDLADLLEARSGFFIRRYGGGLATASLRGSGASQTALLIDGLRLSDPQLGQFDLSLLPAYLIRSVEIVHGPTSALYGADGLAGAINLRGIEPGADSINLLTEVGAYGQRRMSGTAALNGGQASGLIAAEYGYTDGDFPYLNEALFPARVVRRRNADREKRSVFGALEFGAGGHHLKGALLYADAQQGLPGVAGSAEVGERQWDEHVRLWLSDRIVAASNSIELDGFVHSGALRYVNPQLELDETGRVLTSAIQAVFRREVAREGIVLGGVSGGYAAADHPSLDADAREFHGAAFASASHLLRRLRLYPAVRFDAHIPVTGYTRTALSPRLGLNAEILPSIFAKLNVGSAFRMPTFNDRFWQPGGNPDLESERARTLELGLYADHPTLTAELTGYYQRTDNQIVWSPRSEGIWSPENLSETMATGFELSARWRPLFGVEGGGFYAFTRAVNRTDPASRSYDRQLRYVPRHQIKTYVRGGAGPVYAALHGRYVGRRYVTSDETEWLDPTITVDAQVGLSRVLGPFDVQVSLLIENVTDTRYALIQNYPMPPRHARLRLVLETR